MPVVLALADRTDLVDLHAYRSWCPTRHATSTICKLPGSPSYLRPGTLALAKFLIDLGYTTGEFGTNHLGDHTGSPPTAHGFQESWGYLYHLDAMQGVSFPDNTLAAAFAALR